MIEINRASDVLPLISVAESVIDDSTFGFSVCDVEIKMEDGTTCRFFVSAKMKNGRPTLEVATNVGHGSRRKSVTGVKRKPLISD